jgi:hypothetical protein
LRRCWSSGSPGRAGAGSRCRFVDNTAEPVLIDEAGFRRRAREAGLALD